VSGEVRINTWLTRTSLVWSTSTGHDHKRAVLTEYCRAKKMGLTFSNCYNFRPLMTTHFLKMRSKPSQHVFSVIDLAKWAPRITKYEFTKLIPRTNEAAGLIVLSPNSA
jgi:hypothetical protein